MSADQRAADQPDVLDHLVLDFHQMTAFAADPWVFVRGEGVRLQDQEGTLVSRRSLGRLCDRAGLRQRAHHPCGSLTNSAPCTSRRPCTAPRPPAIELAMRLREIAPGGMRGEHGVAVKMLSGGSEATETALKMARQYHKQSGHPRKYKLIGRYGGYHGGTMGALAASGGWERRSVFEPLVAGVLHTHPPACHRCPFDKTYDHGACGITCARLVERTIEAEDPETVAAVIMEPMSISSAGFVVPPPEYFAILRAACDKHNVLLIFDEIITGFGRLGHVVWRRLLRRGARSARLWQGDERWLRASCRRAHRRPGVAGVPRRSGLPARVPPRPHVRRQSGGLRGRAGDARRVRGARPDRARRPNGRPPPRPS